MLSSFSFLTSIAHILPSSEVPLCFSYGYDALLFCPSVDTLRDGVLKSPFNVAADFHRIFKEELLYSKCLFIDDSITPGAPFSSFALTCLDGTLVQQFHSSSFLSSFCVESMAILSALELNLLDLLSLFLRIQCRSYPLLRLYSILVVLLTLFCVLSPCFINCLLLVHLLI